MSQQELVNAYLDGQVSRRTLIRRLVAGGVSLGAAVSYAQLLGPGPASAQARRGGGDDHYPLVQLSIKSRDLGNVIQHARIRVGISTTEELNGVQLDAFLKRRTGLSRIGASNHFDFNGPGEKTISVHLFDTDALRHRRRATIYVYVVRGQDDEGARAFACAKRTLRK